MRIISQDKEIDVPYELVVLKINDVNQIVAQFGGNYLCLGSYNSLEDAKLVLGEIILNRIKDKYYYEMPEKNKYESI